MNYQILIPGGELQNDVLAYLKQAGLAVQFPDRCYKTTSQLPFLEFVLVRATSIPEIVSNPLFPTVLGGFTGSDVLWENGWNRPSVSLPLPTPSRLFLGSIDTVGSLAELKNTTIATKYPNIAKDYFRTKNIPVNIFPIPGKDEALPYLCDQIKAIVGIRDSGNTLRANSLKILDEISPCTIDWIERPDADPTLALFRKQLGL